MPHTRKNQPVITVAAEGFLTYRVDEDGELYAIMASN
jgi:hypothetical protein